MLLPPSRPLRIALFITMACIGSWSLAAVFCALGGQSPSPEARALWMLYVLPPAFAALVVQGPLAKGKLIAPLGLSITLNRWFLIAWVTPLAVLAGTLAAAAAWTGMGIAWPEAGAIPTTRLVLYALPAGLFNGILALAEELGWRGFLWNELEGTSAARSLKIGVVWGIWLFPLAWLGFLYPGATGARTLPIVFLWALVLSQVLGYLRQQSGSVLATALFRGTLIAIWPVANQMTAGGDPLIRPIYGVTGILGGVAVAFLFALHRQRQGLARWTA